MTDAEFEEQKARVSALFDKWVKDLSLEHWRIVLAYEREPGPDIQKNKREGNWRTTFLVNSDWRYEDARITAYLPSLINVDDRDLEEAFVHELCHLHLNETRQDQEDWLDHEERVATKLARAFISLRNAGDAASQVMVHSIPEGVTVELSSAIDSS